MLEGWIRKNAPPDILNTLFYMEGSIADPVQLRQPVLVKVHTLDISSPCYLLKSVSHHALDGWLPQNQPCFLMTLRSKVCLFKGPVYISKIHFVCLKLIWTCLWWGFLWCASCRISFCSPQTLRSKPCLFKGPSLDSQSTSSLESIFFASSVSKHAFDGTFF